MFNLFIKSNTLFRAISGVFSASQPQPNGCVCDAANETTRLGFAEQRYWLHGIFWSIGSILPIKTQNSKLCMYVPIGMWCVHIHVVLHVGSS